MNNKKSYLLWDGDCGVCDYSIRKLAPFLDQDKIQIIPYQFADDKICPPHIRLQCSKAIHFRNENGFFSKAVRALANALKLSGYCKLHFMMTLPGFLQFLNFGYFIIARNRKYISKILGLQVCRISEKN